VKIYKKIVYDKDDNIIESESYEYHGEVAQAGGGNPIKKIIGIAAVIGVVVLLGPTIIGGFQGASGFVQKALIQIGTSLVGGLVGQALAPKMDIPSFGTSLEQGVTVSSKSPTKPYRIIYGSSRVGGTIVYAETTSDTNKFLHMVIVMAGHTIHDMPTIFLNDDAVNLETLSNDSNGIAVFTPTSSDQYYQKLQVKKHFGNNEQLADANLVADVTQWTTAHKISGKAYLYLKFTFDTDVYPNGVPNVSAIVQGKKVFDPRATSFTASSSTVDISQNTITFSSAHGLSLNDRIKYDRNGNTAIGGLSDGTIYFVKPISSTTIRLATTFTNNNNGIAIDLTSVTGSTTQKFNFIVFSDNPVLCIRDFLTNPTFGMQTGDEEINDTNFIASANICDESVTVANPSGTEKRFTCNGSFQVSSSPKIIIENLLTTLGGFLIYSNGKFKIVPATFLSPTVTLNESSLRTGVSINSRVSKSQLFNAVKGLYSEPANDFQPQNYPFLTSSGFQAEDNGERIYAGFDYPFTNSSRMCQRLSKIQLLKVRQQISFSASFDMTAFNCDVGDTVNITNARMGWSNKTFQVLDWGFALNGEDGSLLITANFKETASAIYDFATGDYSTVSSGKATNLPKSTSVSAPTAITLTDELVSYNDGTVIVKLVIELTEATDNFTELYEIEIKQLTDAKGVAVTDDFKQIGRGSRLKYEFLNVIDRASYQIRARGVNIYGVNSSTVTSTHTIVGLSAPPPNVENFACNIVGLDAFLSWQAVDVLDLSYYELRYSSATSNATWGSSVPLVKKVSRPGTSTVVPARTGAYLIKARDKLGNPSVDATVVFVAVEKIGTYNFLTSSTQNPLFTGARDEVLVSTDIAASAGVPALILSGTELFDSVSGNFDADTTRNFDSASQNGQVARLGTYNFNSVIDVGSRITTNITAGIVQFVTDFDDFFDSGAGNFDARIGNFDGDAEANCSSELQIAISNDNTNFTPFQTFVVGDYLARYYKFRLVMTSSNGSATPVVTGLSVTLDMEDRIESGNNIVSGTGTKSVTFTLPYVTVPSLGFAVQNMASGDTYTLSNKTATGFNVAFVNSSGGGVSRTFDFIAKGF
tara:strand:+ start:1037 stop:4324 length:3288 start_codon:yes stop_codon:yes gene_type:complete